MFSKFFIFLLLINCIFSVIHRRIRHQYKFNSFSAIRNGIVRQGTPLNKITINQTEIAKYKYSKNSEDLSYHREASLYDYLFHDYSSDARPVLSFKDQLIVHLDLSLVQIISINEVDQQVIANVWLEQKWLDMRLNWENTNYFWEGGLICGHDFSVIIWFFSIFFCRVIRRINKRRS